MDGVSLSANRDDQVVVVVMFLLLQQQLLSVSCHDCGSDRVQFQNGDSERLPRGETVFTASRFRYSINSQVQLLGSLTLHSVSCENGFKEYILHFNNLMFRHNGH